MTKSLLTAGVTTIAGGRWNQGSGHIDGPSEDAKFSNDFDVVYVGSSCSLLVIDRGNKAIREIELNYDDCNTQYADSLNLGIKNTIIPVVFIYRSSHINPSSLPFILIGDMKSTISMCRGSIAGCCRFFRLSSCSTPT